jgi:hypothetical protein
MIESVLKQAQIDVERSKVWQLVWDRVPTLEFAAQSPWRRGGSSREA